MKAGLPLTATEYSPRARAERVIASAAICVGGMAGTDVSSECASRRSASCMSVTRREQFGHVLMCAEIAEFPGMSDNLIVDRTLRHSEHVVISLARAMMDDPREGERAALTAP